MKKLLLNLSLFILFYSTSLFGQQINEDDISIDDVVLHLEHGNTEVLTDKKVTLNDVHFETGNSILLASDKLYLDSLSNYLRLMPTTDIYLNGYTDNIGSPTNNIKLSRKRALIVKDYLIQKGVFADQIKSEGYGAARPVATNKTAEGRQKNRRVELKFRSETEESESKSKPSVITLKDNSKISAEFFMFDQDGQTMSYKEKLSDKVIKKLRVPDINEIRLPSGEKYDLSKIPTPDVIKSNPNSVITLKNGDKISAETFSINQTGDSITYQASDKVLKKLRIPDVSEIRLPSGQKYDLIKIPTANTPVPKPASTITLKNGNTISAEFLMINHAGDSVSYKETLNDTQVKKLSLNQISNIKLPTGESYDLSKIPAPESVRIKPTIKYTPDNSFTKKEPDTIIEKPPVDPPKTVQPPAGPPEWQVTLKRIINRISPFAFIGRSPILTNPINATIYVHNLPDTNVKTSLYRKEQGGCIGFTFGLEYEFGDNYPTYYSRFTWAFGANDQSNFHSFMLGVGKTLGKTNAWRTGVDIGTSTAFNKLNPVSIKGDLNFGDVIYRGTGNFKVRNFMLTISPNVSYEYTTQNYYNQTVRISFGFPVSIPLSSELRLNAVDIGGHNSTSDESFDSPTVDFILDNERQTSYSVSSIIGWYLSIGYIFK